MKTPDLGEVDGSGYRYLGFHMASVKIGAETWQIHLYDGIDEKAVSLCGNHGHRELVDRGVATGKPDCSDCIRAALLRWEDVR